MTKKSLDAAIETFVPSFNNPIVRDTISRPARVREAAISIVRTGAWDCEEAIVIQQALNDLEKEGFFVFK